MNVLDAFYIPAAVVTSPWWAQKARSGWGERFGKIEALPAKSAGVKRVLVHAVSVGEVNALRELVPLLRGAGVEVAVSVGTDTGIARARALFGEMGGVWVVRYALDFSWAVDRFLRAVNPDVVALVELEVWPNFVKACEARGVPVCVLNGRLSARSFKGYSRVRGFLKGTFGRLALAAVQDEAYAARFRAMGVAPERVRVTGSMKWDAASVIEDGRVPAESVKLREEMGIDPDVPLVVAGSTAPIESDGNCEEALLHAACPAGVQLLCAPRKPEHYETAFKALGGAGMCARRSAKVRAARGTNRFLLDTIGELRAAYALADVVVVGRTFGALGGSDPIEPVALGKATICGPGFGNFESATDTLRQAGALRVVTAEGLRETLETLLKDGASRAEMGRRGVACVRANQGATRRHAELVLGLAGVNLGAR